MVPEKQKWSENVFSLNISFFKNFIMQKKRKQKKNFTQLLFLFKI